ncbi:MAG TPA: hypothetical protein P5531_09415 [Bacteroidales bacterium]|nr:hypothetical protein [Bacteroidales bacterium]HSA43424.1 hypothetical protein [Bacteroidales bacterium]
MRTGIFLLAVILASCAQKQEKPLVTERIQYDVSIKSPDPEFDWWVQNIEGSRRENFVKSILNAAYSGKLKAFDIFHTPMSPEEVIAIGNRTDTILTTSPVPPYNDTLMEVKQSLDLQRITKVRFLEEWWMDEKSLQFEKKVIGIAPILEVFNEDGSLRGYMPMFWVYLDPAYPGKLKIQE